MDKKATDIRVLELGELLGITDFFVIASVSNERQLATVVEEVEYRLKRELERAPRRREGTKDTGWMLLDYGDIVVHAFTVEQRDYYGLERLWSDAPVTVIDDAVGGPEAGSPVTDHPADWISVDGSPVGGTPDGGNPDGGTPVDEVAAVDAARR